MWKCSDIIIIRQSVVSAVRVHTRLLNSVHSLVPSHVIFFLMFIIASLFIIVSELFSDARKRIQNVVQNTITTAVV